MLTAYLLLLSEYQLSVYWPNRLGQFQNMLRTQKTFMILSWWCPFEAGKGHLPARQFIKMNGLILVSTHLCFHQTAPLNVFSLSVQQIQLQTYNRYMCLHVAYKSAFQRVHRKRHIKAPPSQDERHILKHLSLHCLYLDIGSDIQCVGQLVSPPPPPGATSQELQSISCV